MTKEKFNELLQKSRNGNKNAFEKIYGEFYQKMLYTATCVTGNWEDAKDAVQQAFAKFWKFILGYDNIYIDYPAAYLCKVSKRCAIEIMQENDQYRSFEGLEILATDDSYEERSIGEAVYKEAIQKLKEPNKTVAIQFFVYKARIKEIAEDTGESVGTIKWWISEIKKRFKTILKKQ